jgi:hypothetical protein
VVTFSAASSADYFFIKSAVCLRSSDFKNKNRTSNATGSHEYKNAFQFHGNDIHGVTNKAEGTVANYIHFQSIRSNKNESLYFRVCDCMDNSSGFVYSHN